jgi:hypothetical protein
LSLALDGNGYPAIVGKSYEVSYSGFDAGSLELARWNGTQWDYDRIDQYSQISHHTQDMALGTDGQPHVTYVDAGKQSVNYAYRKDGSWFTDTVYVYERYFENSPSIAVDGQNRPHISFTEDMTLYYAYKDEGNWITMPVDGGSRWNKIDVNSHDIPHIAYHDGQGHLAYARLGETGWIKDMETAGGWNLDFTFDNEDDPHIVHYNPDSPDPSPRTHLYLDDGDWISETITTESCIGGLSLAIDSSGSAHVGLICRLAGDFYPDPFYAQKTDTGWLVEQIDDLGSGPYNIAISVDAEDNPHLSYVRGLGYTASLIYAEKKDGQWHIDTPVQGYVTGSTAIEHTGRYPVISYHDRSLANYMLAFPQAPAADYSTVP